MQHRNFTLSLFVVLSAILIAACETTGAEKQSSKPISPNDSRLVLLHLGDLHGHIDVGAQGRGGYARIAHLIKEERAKAGPKTDVVVIAPGDVVDKGNLPCRNTKDRACLALLSSVGIDLAVLGNAELYRGQSGIAEIAKYSKIPWVSSNVTTSTTSPSASWKEEYFYRGPKSGAKFWLFSWVRNPYTGREIPRSSKIKIKEVINDRDWASWAQKSQIAPVLWVHHQRWEDDLGFAADACSQEGLKSLAFISADDHVENFDSTACAPVAQAAPYGESIGRFEFSVNSEGQLFYSSHKFIKVDESVEQDGVVLKLVEDLYARYAPKAREVIAQLPSGLSQTEVGEWIAEAMRNSTHTDLALLNSGAIKSGLQPGALDREKLFLAAPYNNNIMGLDWSFSSLESSLCAASKREKNPELDDGSDLYIAGGKLVGAGTDDCKLEVKNKRRSLKVAVDSYLLGRSNRWLGRDISRVAFRFGFKTEEVVERYLKKNRGFH